MAIVRGCAFPDDLAYDEDLNLWFRDVGAGIWEVGVTEFGSLRVGEIYMFNPRPVGRLVEAGRAFAVIEVAKTVLAMRCPFDCTIEAANVALALRPAPLNKDPYGNWLCRLAAACAIACQTARDTLIQGDAVIPRAIALMDLNAFDGSRQEGPGAPP